MMIMYVLLFSNINDFVIFRYNRYLKQAKQQNTGSSGQQTKSFERRASSGNSSNSSNNFPVRKRSYSFSEGHCKSVTSVTPAKR